MGEAAYTQVNPQIGDAEELPVATDAEMAAGREALHVFGIGAQKAGTTWLYDYFRDRADVLTNAKEYHYFEGIDDDLNADAPGVLERIGAAFRARVAPRAPEPTGPSARMAAAFRENRDGPARHEAYARHLYAGYAGETCVCDISPSYTILSEAGFREMRAFAPRSKFILILRDPVDRMWSQARMRATRFARRAEERGEENPSATPEAQAEVLLEAFDPGLPNRSNYIHTLTALDRAVPEGDRLVLFYESFFAERDTGPVTRFLGLPPAEGDFDRLVLPRDRGKASAGGPDAALAGQMREALRPVYDYAIERFGAAVPAHWRERLDA